MKRFLISCFFLLMLLDVAAQEPRQQRLVFGLQFKPIVPLEVTRTRQEIFLNNDITYTNRQRTGYALALSGVARALDRNDRMDPSGLNRARHNREREVARWRSERTR